MLRYIAKRLILLIPVLIGVSFVTFTLLYISPGDTVTAIVAAGGVYTPEEQEQMREEMGLNDSFLVQYFDYLKGIVTKFDFGMSYVSKKPVAEEVMERFPTTLLMAALALTVAVGVGLPVGIISATKQNSLFDKLLTPISMLGVSMPSFWFGLLMIILFSLELGLLPASGFYGPSYWILPSFTVGFNIAAYIMRMTRSSMLEVIRQDYIRTARAKGQTERVVIMRHAFKNARIPILTAVGLQFGYLLGGSVLAETVFAVPGIGKMILDGITGRNYPVVQGGILFFAFMFCFVNLLVDVLYAFVDPRIKSQYVKRKERANG